MPKIIAYVWVSTDEQNYRNQKFEMLTYPMYAALFDFCVTCPQTKILIFQGAL